MPASIRPPNAPTAAASVGVANPKTMEPSTATISTARGKNDASSILKISSRCQFIIQQTTTRLTMPRPSTIQYQRGTGSRSAAAAGALASSLLAVTLAATGAAA